MAKSVFHKALYCIDGPLIRLARSRPSPNLYPPQDQVSVQGMEELQALLQSRYNPDVPATVSGNPRDDSTDPTKPNDIDACIGIRVGETQVVIRPQPTHLIFVQARPDFVIHFADFESLDLILGNMQQALLGFTENRFRSSGYILWTFQTIRMFKAKAVA